MSKNTHYKVIFDDGDIDIEMFPEEDDENFEDYDPTNFKQVKNYAKTITGSRIDKVIRNVKTA